MRKYAILNDNTVTSTLMLSDDEVVLQSVKNQLVLDIEDLLIQPQVGWVLTGNALTPAPGQVVSLKEMIKARVKHYQESAPELLRNLYAENTLLGITAQQSDEMFTDFQDVLIRIREGAWPTALYRLQQKQPAGFVTQEMIDRWAAMIQSGIIQ